MTREERLKKWEIRRRKRRIAFIRKISILCMAILLIIGGVFLFKSDSKASDEHLGMKKLYKTIHVHAGDTLWSLAEENIYGYDSVHDYINEVAFINNLTNTNRIRSGEILVIPYYVDLENLE